MLHLIIFGLLLGWGAAIPIGPINLEIIRRNLHFGTLVGIAFGLGACTADLIYLVLLSLGILNILVHPLILKVIGLMSSIILIWFGVQALKLNSTKIAGIKGKNTKEHSVWRNFVEGCGLTLVNPYNILFWTSVSSTLILTTHHHIVHYATLYEGLGVLVGTWSWAISLNITLHFTRHRLSELTMKIINLSGGCILIGIALVGIWHALVRL